MWIVLSIFVFVVYAIVIIRIAIRQRREDQKLYADIEQLAQKIAEMNEIAKGDLDELVKRSNKTDEKYAELSKRFPELNL